MQLLKIISIGVFISCFAVFGISLSKKTDLKFHHAELLNSTDFQEGDIIFQSSISEQCEAIKLATKSEYTHCGIIFKEGNEYFVLEAVQPVSSTPLKNWTARDENGHYVVKRLRNADSVLTDEVLQKMKTKGKEYLGKDYDMTFEWSDDKIYCSELVWKLYNHATGMEVGKLQQLKEFDLTSKQVKQKLKERYGKKVPLNEIVISPGSIFDSNLLITVYSN
jgi:uncharacterized protein YycO